MPDALRPGVQHPLVMAGAGAGARLPAAEDVLDLPRGEVGLDLDGAEHRFVADVLVPDGQGQVDGQAVVGHLLIFHRAVDRDVGVAIAPVGREAGGEAVDPLGDDGKVQVAALAHHLPAGGTPGIGVLQKEIGGHAGKDGVPVRLQPVGPVPVPPDGQVKVGGAGDRRGVPPDRLVPPVDVAVEAPGADLMAAVPGVPDGQGGHLLSKETFLRHYTTPPVGRQERKIHASGYRLEARHAV